VIDSDNTASARPYEDFTKSYFLIANLLNPEMLILFRMRHFRLKLSNSSASYCWLYATL